MCVDRSGSLFSFPHHFIFFKEDRSLRGCDKRNETLGRVTRTMWDDELASASTNDYLLFRIRFLFLLFSGLVFFSLKEKTQRAMCDNVFITGHHQRQPLLMKYIKTKVVNMSRLYLWPCTADHQRQIVEREKTKHSRLHPSCCCWRWRYFCFICLLRIFNFVSFFFNNTCQEFSKTFLMATYLAVDQFLADERRW